MPMTLNPLKLALAVTKVGSAVYLRSVWAGHGLTTVWAAAMRTWWKECEEASSGGSGAQAGCITAPTVGDKYEPLRHRLALASVTTTAA
jgi:hypothetical protein